MPDQSTTYQKEMATPAHKPGMEAVVNRGPQHAVASEGDTRDSSGNRTGERKTVSPPTQSAFGPSSASDPAPAPPPAQKPPASNHEPLSVIGKVRDQQVSDIVDKAAGSGADNE